MDRRANIVRAAADLFARQGYRATTVADISLAVGLSPSAGGLYRHFGSKEALLDAVVDLALDQVNAARDLQQKLSVERDPLDPVVEAQLVGRFLLDRLRENRSVLTIMDRDLIDHPRLLHRARAELITPVMSGLTDWINHLAIDDRNPDLDADALAEVMWGALYSRAMHDHHTVPDAQALAAWAAGLVGALRTPSAATTASAAQSDV